MMSLVGCSGEEFAAILSSLGFRMQKKKVQKPAHAADMPVPAAAEAPATDAPLEEVAPAESEAPISAELVTSSASSEDPAPSEQPSSPAESAEEIEIEVWWPRDTGPFRHQQKKPETRRHRPKNRPKPEAKPEVKSEEQPKPPPKPERKPEKPRRPEKPVDPDSPFAILGQLKAGFAKKS
jgi:ATP-dependent RNA helicase SUPV3L1/SUV3